MNNYQLENWETFTWKREKDKREYLILLCQDLFGNWIIKRQWGRAGTKGGSKCHILPFSEGQAYIRRLVKIRGYRKYARVDSKD